ncbi:hypothetical protein DEJ27_13195 [Curtobacterium sp. MCPF17_018]|uniref:hypothetical protein n=1 Tax=Curtobacterium sp. MCPF17_018 TaxID=2175638 RepID=UPI000DA996DB|nr:hypothetical protein [Curtobacterium sp. MCPF17_018]PZE66836.1 hypothetical protein DEJ27_13195 [Curtobacterium sp. MCPF17_018]
MTGADDNPTHYPSQKRDRENPDTQQDANPKDPAFDAARELGKQLAKGMGYAAGKHLFGAAAKHIEQNPDDNFFTRLFDWLRNL